MSSFCWHKNHPWSSSFADLSHAVLEIHTKSAVSDRVKTNLENYSPPLSIIFVSSDYPTLWIQLTIPGQPLDPYCGPLVHLGPSDILDFVFWKWGAPKVQFKWVSDTKVIPTYLANIGQLEHYVVFGTKSGAVKDFPRENKCPTWAKQYRQFNGHQHQFKYQHHTVAALQ